MMETRITVRICNQNQNGDYKSTVGDNSNDDEKNNDMIVMVIVDNTIIG